MVMTANLILDGLARHLSKLRQATITFAPAPQDSLQWAASESLTQAIGLLGQTGERVRDTSTKLGLVLSGATSSTAAVKSISDEMRACCDTLVASLGVLVQPQCGAGGPLMDLYCQQVRSILRAIEELVKHSTSTYGPIQDAGPRTGVIWSACEQIGKLPKSNKVAYRRSLLQHQAAVRDTLREFRGMLEQQDQEERGEEVQEAEGGEEEGRQHDAEATGQEVAALGEMGLMDDDDDFFGGGSDVLSEWEKVNVERCLVALGHCGGLLKALLGAVDEATQGPNGGGREVMMAVALIEEECSALSAAVVNAADALYPPQIRQELESQLGALVEAANGALKAIEKLPNGPATALCHQEVEAIRQASATGVALFPDDEEEGTGPEEDEDEE